MTTISPKVGTVVTSSVVFSAGGVVGDPGVVTCKVRDPAAVVVTETYNPGDITRTGAGAYELNILVTLEGMWTVEWIGSGTGPNVVECKTFLADEACI